MNVPFSKTLVLVLALVAIGLLCPCLPVFRTMARRMSIRPITSWAFKPRPIGRFLVDLPDQAVVGQWYQTYGGSGRISVEPEVSPEAFERAVAERAEALRSTPNDKGGCQLVEDIKLDTPHSRVLLFWPERHYKGILLKADSYTLRGDDLYRFEGETWVDPVKQGSNIRWLHKLFQAIRPLQPDEIPGEYGFCFDHSILVDEPTPIGPETVIATAIWLDHPDVHISLSTFTNGANTDPPLLQRLSKPSLFSGIKVLRSGRRDLASGEMGEEHLERVREGNGTVGHLFVWEAQGLPGFKYEHPQIRLEMSTGNGRHGPVQASLSDRDAMQLWDAVVGSLRLRPTKMPTG